MSSDATVLVDLLQKDNSILEEQNDILKAKLATALEALRFYADKDGTYNTRPQYGDVMSEPIWSDQGAKATAAIKEIER